MKKIITLAMVLGWMVALSARADSDAVKYKTVTLQGTLIDLSCYLDDGDKGNNHMGAKGCGTACLKEGSPAGLLVGDRVYYLIFPAVNFAKYVGETVEVTGDLYGTDALIPAKAAWVAADGKKPIKWSVKPMM
ncbi:MAG: hypothetical protein ACREL1_03610 [bacterium]